MFKVMGLILIIASGAAAGGSKAIQLHQSVSEWEQYLCFLRIVREELQYTMAPVEQIILSAGKRDEIKNFAPLQAFCCHYQPQQSFIPQWQFAVEKGKAHLNSELADKFSAFCGIFGQYDAEIQLKSLQMLQAEAEEKLISAKQICVERSRFYSTMGLLGGLGLAILLC